MVLPSIVGTPTLAGAVLGGDPTVTTPTGATIGHRLLAMCTSSVGGTVWTPHADFQALPGSVGGQVPLFYHDLIAAPAANYQFVVSGAGNANVMMVAIANWGSLEDIDFASVASGALTLPALDCFGEDRLRLDLLVRLASATWTLAAGNEVFDAVAGTSNYGCAVGADAESPGTSASRLCTPSQSASASVGYTLMIAPPPNGGAGFLGLL